MSNYDSIANLPLEERHEVLRRWLEDLTTVYEKCAAERDAQIESASYLAGKLAEVDRERLDLLDQLDALESALTQEKERLHKTTVELGMNHRRLFEDYERLQAENRQLRALESPLAPRYTALRDAADNLASTVAAYFNKRGAAHSDRKGNEDIAAMADALSDYGYAINQIEVKDARLS